MPRPAPEAAPAQPPLTPAVQETLGELLEWASGLTNPDHDGDTVYSLSSHDADTVSTPIASEHEADTVPTPIASDPDADTVTTPDSDTMPTLTDQGHADDVGDTILTTSADDTSSEPFTPADPSGDDSTTPMPSDADTTALTLDPSTLSDHDAADTVSTASNPATPSDQDAAATVSTPTEGDTVPMPSPNPPAFSDHDVIASDVESMLSVESAGDDTVPTPGDGDTVPTPDAPASWWQSSGWIDNGDTVWDSQQHR